MISINLFFQYNCLKTLKPITNESNSVTKWFECICLWCNFPSSSTTTSSIIRPWKMRYVIFVEIKHQFLPVLAAYFEIIFKFWPIHWKQIAVLYHGKFCIHSSQWWSISNLRHFLFTMNHDKTTCWNKACGEKWARTSLHYPFVNL